MVKILRFTIDTEEVVRRVIVVAKYLFVNTVILLGTPEFLVLQLMANTHKDAFRGLGYIEGRNLDEIYAVFKFDDPERLNAVKWVFEKLIHDKLGYKTKSLIQVRNKLPMNFRIVTDLGVGNKQEPVSLDFDEKEIKNLRQKSIFDLMEVIKDGEKST